MCVFADIGVNPWSRCDQGLKRCHHFFFSIFFQFWTLPSFTMSVKGKYCSVCVCVCVYESVSEFNVFVRLRVAVMRRALVFFPPFLLFFSSPGKVNTCSLYSSFSSSNCWTVCAPLVLLLPGLSCKSLRRRVSISGWALSKQMYPWNGQRDTRMQLGTHKHTHILHIGQMSLNKT